jgi:hypothetical protein
LCGLLAIAWRSLRRLARIDAAMPTLVTIAEQFKPNGGDSLRDQIDKINGKLAKGEQRFETVEDMIRDHNARFDGIDRQLRNINNHK